MESIEFVEEDPDVKLEEELPGEGGLIITMGVTKPRNQRHAKVRYKSILFKSILLRLR